VAGYLKVGARLEQDPESLIFPITYAAMLTAGSMSLTEKILAFRYLMKMADLKPR
jgi:hypothetical protein